MCSLFHLCRSRGWELYHEGKREEAIAEWRVAADLDPEDGYILTSIGQALSELGRQEEAFSEWWKAIHLEPKYDVPYIYLADALFGSGYTFKALTTIRTALHRCPASAHLHIRLGHYLMEQADKTSDRNGWQAAGTAFQQALDIEPANTYAFRHLAKVLWLTEQKHKAIETLKAAIMVNPDNAEAHVQLWNYQAGVRDFWGMIRTGRAIDGLPDSEARDQHYAQTNKLAAKGGKDLLAGMVFVGIVVGSWIWYRRRG